MKIAFNIGSVPITIYDDTAVWHEEEIHELFDEYNELIDSPVGELEEEEPICERLDAIRGTLGSYGYKYDNTTGSFS